MTRAFHTFPATASARTTSSAKTPARVFMYGPEQPMGAFNGLLGDEARSARAVGHRWIGVRQDTDANANTYALVMRCALH
jgi:hypothetical protein